MPLAVLPDYLGTREDLPECCSRWHYSSLGFRRSRSIYIQVLSDALPLEGVPTRITRVANRCALRYHLYFMCV
jgi:hypothetical protein